MEKYRNYFRSSVTILRNISSRIEWNKPKANEEAFFSVGDLQFFAAEKIGAIVEMLRASFRETKLIKT